MKVTISVDSDGRMSIDAPEVALDVLEMLLSRATQFVRRRLLIVDMAAADQAAQKRVVIANGVPR